MRERERDQCAVVVCDCVSWGSRDSGNPDYVPYGLRARLTGSGGSYRKGETIVELRRVLGGGGPGSRTSQVLASGLLVYCVSASRQSQECERQKGLATEPAGVLRKLKRRSKCAQGCAAGSGGSHPISSVPNDQPVAIETRGSEATGGRRQRGREAERRVNAP